MTQSKAGNLRTLAENRLNVPDFFVLDADVFSRHLFPFRNDIKNILNRITAGDVAGLNAAAREIREMILNIGLDYGDRNKIIFEYRRLKKGDKYVAVRSSAMDEDSGEHSFAGQLDSYLCVSESDLIEKIKLVWASVFSARSLLYRIHSGLSFDALAVSVVLQKMINAKKAGVAFSKNPNTGRGELMITAGWGLGEGIVSDRVESDTYIVHELTGIVTKSISVKTKMAVPDDEKGTGIKYKAVPNNRKAISVLGDRELQAVMELALAAEQVFGVPQDIEWALDEKNRLYILQSRPITTIKRRRQSNVYDNSNIVESFAGISLPLTFSFAKHLYEVALRESLKGLCAFSKNAYKTNSEIFPSMIEHVYGRIYYNLGNWYRMLSLLPVFSQSKKAWEDMVGIKKSLKVTIRHGCLSATLSKLLLVRKLLGSTTAAEKFMERFRAEYSKYSKLDISRMNAESLRHVYAKIEKSFLYRWQPALENDLFAMLYHQWTRKAMKSWAADEDGSLLNDLLVGEKGMDSVEPAKALLEIAAIIRKEEALAGLFRAGDTTAIMNYKDEPFRKLLNEYLIDYSSRIAGELKLETENPSTAPKFIVSMIQSYLDGDTEFSKFAVQMSGKRNKAEKTLNRRLKYRIVRSHITKWLLSRTRAAIASRENMRLARSKMFGLARTIFCRFGELLHEKGLIDNEKDVFYLRTEEIFENVVSHTELSDLRALVKKRKSEISSYGDIRLPDRFVADPIDFESLPDGVERVDSAHEEHQHFRILTGIGCTTGRVRAKCVIVDDPRSAGDISGKILVAKMTDPGWVFLMISAAGLVVERGSILSHTAIIGRELGIPTVVSVENASTILSNGQEIVLDGAMGEIAIC